MGLPSATMENWLAGAAGIIVTGFVLQQLAQGGRRWRSLSIAEHELQVVRQLPDGSDVRPVLAAHAERLLVEQYLHVPSERSVAG